MPRKGQNRLEGAVAALLGRAAGRIALDEQNFAFRRIALLTIGELAGERRDVESALAAGQLARLAGGFAGGRRFHHLADDGAGLCGVLLKPVVERLVDDVLDRGSDLRGDELVLGLRGEFRVRHLHRHHRRQAFAAIVARERDLLALGEAGGFGVAIDLARQRGAKARQMRAAIPLRNVVGEAQHGLVVGIVPPQRDLHADPVALGADDHRLVDQRGLGAVDVAHEGLDTALVHELFALALGMAVIRQDDAHARIQEREFPQPMLQGVVIVLDHRERIGRGQEGDFRALPALGIAHHRERRHGLAMAELHGVFLAVTENAQLEPARQGVDHRDADAVQAARDLVGILVEFPARMELGHDDLGGRDALPGVDVDGNAATVIGHGDRPVGVQRDRDLGGVTGERLVDGVVHHLVDHVVEARTVIGVADIHAGTLADRIEALEDLDGISPIGIDVHVCSRFGH